MIGKVLACCDLKEAVVKNTAVKAKLVSRVVYSDPLELAPKFIIVFD